MALGHQLIIFKDPPTNEQAKENMSMSELEATIIKPSSLNYKVSLDEALEAFVKKQESEGGKQQLLNEDKQDDSQQLLKQAEMEDCLFAVEVLRGPHFSGLYDEQCANMQLVGQWNAEAQKLQRKYEKLALQ